MIKRFLAIIAVALGVIAYVPPANAATVWNESHCHNHGVITAGGLATGTVTVCVEVQYRLQDDGDGLRLEYAWIDINNGCNSTLLDSPYLKYTHFYTEYLNYSLYSGQQVSEVYNCHVTRDLELAGPDHPNEIYAVFDYQLNINNATNWDDEFEFCIGVDHSC